MGLFSFFSNIFKPKSDYEKLRSMVGPMLVKAYRKIAKERGLAPTSKTSDKKIVDIYIQVENAFKEAAKQRNEEIPQPNIHYIVLYFYQVYEGYQGNDLCESLFQSQIDFEIKNYLSKGLPKRFCKELHIFEDEQ